MCSIKIYDSCRNSVDGSHVVGREVTVTHDLLRLLRLQKPRLHRAIRFKKPSDARWKYRRSFPAEANICSEPTS